MMYSSNMKRQGRWDVLSFLQLFYLMFTLLTSAQHNDEELTTVVKYFQANTSYPPIYEYYVSTDIPNEKYRANESTLDAFKPTSLSAMKTMDSTENDKKRFQINEFNNNISQSNMVSSAYTVSSANPFNFCNEFSTCDFVSKLHYKFCNCDEKCLLFQDCCFDANLGNTENGTIRSSNTQFVCTPFSTQPEPKPILGIYIIKSCPESLQNSTINKNCTTYDLLTSGPWVISDDNTVYQNKYCAECNDVAFFKVFSIKLTNMKSDFVSDLINSSAFEILQEAIMQSYDYYGPVINLVAPKETSPRYCFFYSPATHSEFGCEKHDLIPVYYTNFFSNKLYRNKYCAPLLETFCLKELLADLFVGAVFGFHPMSVMFSFNEKEDECESQAGGLCLNDELYKDFPFKKSFSFASSTAVSEEDALKIVAALLWPFREELILRLTELWIATHHNSTSSVVHLVIDGTFKKPMNGRETLDMERKLFGLRWKFHITLLNLHEIDSNTENTIDHDYPITHREKYNNFTGYMYSLDIRQKSESYIDLTTCKYLHMEIENVNNSRIHPSLIINSIKCLLKEIETTALIGQADITLNVITYSGMGLSIIGLMISIIIHRRTELHRSVPGSNVENLSIALLISNGIFMVGIGANDYQIVCYCLSVTLHYLWLSVFTFKSIALVYMCHSIISMTVMDTVGALSKTKGRFTLLGLVLPFLFVVPPLIIDNLNVSGLKVSYAGSVCFPTGFLGNILFVSLPIGLSVILNISCLLCIAYFITKQSFATKRVRRTASVDCLGVYTRISVVTGIFWITGIINGIYPTFFLEYLFVTICSLQGVFISIANLTSKRVLRKLRKTKKSTESIKTISSH